MIGMKSRRVRVKGFGGRESLKLSFDEFVRRIRTIERKKERKEGIITPLVGVAKLHLVINERKPVEEKAVFYHGKWCSMLLRSLADNLVCDPRKGRK